MSCGRTRVVLTYSLQSLLLLASVLSLEWMSWDGATVHAPSRSAEDREGYPIDWEGLAVERVDVGLEGAVHAGVHHVLNLISEIRFR